MIITSFCCPRGSPTANPAPDPKLRIHSPSPSLGESEELLLLLPSNVLCPPPWKPSLQYSQLVVLSRSSSSCIPILNNHRLRGWQKINSLTKDYTKQKRFGEVLLRPSCKNETKIVMESQWMYRSHDLFATIIIYKAPTDIYHIFWPDLSIKRHWFAVLVKKWKYCGWCFATWSFTISIINSTYTQPSRCNTVFKAHRDAGVSFPWCSCMQTWMATWRGVFIFPNHCCSNSSQLLRIQFCYWSTREIKKL